MNAKSIGVLLISLILGCRSFAQIVISEDKDILQYLKQVNELDDEERCSVFSVNLLTFEGFSEKDQCGLYRIGVFADHTSNHLMWLDNGQKFFINCKTDLFDVLQKIFTFWKETKCQISDSDKLLYIERILNTFYNNQVKPYSLEPTKIVE